MTTAWKLRGCAGVGRGVRALGRVVVRGSGRILVGDDVVLDGRDVPVELHAGAGAVLSIGNGCVIQGGASLEATLDVALGDGVRIGPYAKVIDNSFHPLTGDRHARPASTAVVLGPGVVVGPRAIILPGARIGAGAVVGPGTVVSRRVPAGVVVAGVPARATARPVAALLAQEVVPAHALVAVADPPWAPAVAPAPSVVAAAVRELA